MFSGFWRNREAGGAAKALAVSETGTVVEDNKVEWRCLDVIRHNISMNCTIQIKKQNEQGKDREKARKQRVMAYHYTGPILKRTRYVALRHP
jgi:hypothetical protein